MTRDEAEIILEAIHSVSQYHNETQYDPGPLSINARGINVLEATVRGLVDDDDC